MVGFESLLRDEMYFNKKAFQGEVKPIMGNCTTCTNGISCLSESEMIDRILKSETQLVDELFKPYDVRARSIARRFLFSDTSRIDDVVQEATMKAYLNLNRLRNRERFGSWCLTIVRNMAIDAAKRENLYIDKPIDDSTWDFDSWLMNRPCNAVEPSERISLADMAQRLKSELSILDRAYGEPLWMLYFEERSYNEIADILGKPLGTIKSLIHRGKAILRERIYGEATAAA